MFFSYFIYFKAHYLIFVIDLYITLLCKNLSISSAAELQYKCLHLFNFYYISNVTN